MNRNLPARIEHDPRIKKLIWLAVEYIVLRLLAKYSQRIIEKGAVLLVHMLFSAKRKKGVFNY